MKFFLPHAANKTREEKKLSAIKKFAKETIGWEISDRRIFSIDYIHDGRRYYAEVGKINDTNGETIIAILESNAYLICTANRGVIRGMPILVGADEAISVVDFEE